MIIYTDGRKNKYHAKKITVDGETFDSKKELNRYRELQLLEKSGKIWDLCRQVKFELIPAQYKDGKCVERACTYIADFVYKDKDGTHVEDTKGMKTPEYIMKRKYMLYHRGIRIIET